MPRLPEKQLLILADSSPFRRSLVEGLLDLGYRSKVVSGWEEGLRMWEDHPERYSLGLFDLTLGDCPPEQWIRSIREIAPSAELPVFTLRDSPTVFEEVLEMKEEGIVGAFVRNAPLVETLYRIDSFLQSRSPEHFVRPPRIDFMNPVRFSVMNRRVPSSHISLAQNLSRTGMLVNTWSPPRVNSRLELKFQLPVDECLIECTGRVARVLKAASGPDAAGIEFDDLGDRDSMVLMHYVLDTLHDFGAALPVL